MAIKFTGPRITWKMLWIVVSWRWFTGNTLDGEPRTDAGWFRKGTRSVDPRYPHPSRWQLMKRWQRMAIRLGSMLAPVTAVMVWLVWPTAFYRLSVVLTMILLVILVRVGMKWYEGYDLRNHILKPFALTAAPMVNQAPSALERDMQITMGHRQDDGLVPIRITLPVPPEYNGTDSSKKSLVSLANVRLGGEWTANLNARRWPFYVALSRLEDPRTNFSYAELSLIIEDRSGPGKVILGAGTSDIVIADIVNRFPHVGMSIGTGGGKSSFYRNVIAQLSYWGDDEFDVCDVKRVSLKGMERVPGLSIHTDVEKIWEVVHDFYLEMESRYKEVENFPTELPPDHFKAKYLFLEEMNAFTMMSAIRWGQVKDKGDSKREPVWDDIKLIAVMARAVNMHMFGAWQILLVIAAGGDAQLRDQLGLKILSRFSPQAWDMLTGLRPREPSSSVPGRAVAVMDGERKRFQMPLVTVEDAMDMVTKGRAWARHNGLLVPAPPQPQRRKPSPRRRNAA
jgi:hypothetical protein